MANNSDHTQHALKIIRDFENKVQHDFNLQSRGSGGAMADDIERLDVYFTSKKNLGIKEARILEVSLVEEFLNLINHNAKIIPYLHNYPAGCKNVEISISVENSDQKSPNNGVNWCTIINGKVYYYGEFDPKIRTYKILHEEPYEEALKMVRNSKQQVYK